MRALEHFIIMANTTNSYMIREFFLDLKRILTEYNKNQTVYRSQLRAHEQLIMKDSQIQELRNDIHLLMEKSDFQATQLKVQYQQLEGPSQQLEVQNQQLDVQSQQLDVLSKLLYKESDDKVLDIECTQKKQELVVLQNKVKCTWLERFKVIKIRLTCTICSVNKQRNRRTIVSMSRTIR